MLGATTLINFQSTTSFVLWEKVEEIELNGKIYYWERDTDDVYDPETQERIGIYNRDTCMVKPLRQDFFSGF